MGWVGRRRLALTCALLLVPILGCGRPEARNPAREAPRGYRSEIHCPCGYRGPHEPREVERLILEGKTIQCPEGGFLLPCPSCGKTTAYLVTWSPSVRTV